MEEAGSSATLMLQSRREDVARARVHLLKEAFLRVLCDETLVLCGP